MAPAPESIDDWLASPPGQAYLAAERDAIAPALSALYGPTMLQVGKWGDTDVFAGLAGTVYRAVTAPRPAEGLAMVARPEQLPIASQCVESVLLPHTLELSLDPHEVLRESERVLLGGGKLLVCGFNPISPVGLRRLASRGAWPPGLKRLVSERRLRDWLALLGFDVTRTTRYFSAIHGSGRVAGRLRALPMVHGAFMLQAVKRVRMVTPIRRRWRAPAKVGAGLAEPSTRSPIQARRRTPGTGTSS